MNGFLPSDAQARAIAEIRDWFLNRSCQQKIFRLFGHAGSGKSTVLRFAFAELGHSTSVSSRHCVPEVVTATFTGKAALVLRRKGTPARTIQSLIYSVIQATEEEVGAAAAKIEEARRQARGHTGFEKTTAEAAIEAMRQALALMKHPRFTLNPQSDAALTKLVVLDEVSMVDDEMARDLMNFNKPILVLGDPGQLPPIKGDQRRAGRHAYSRTGNREDLIFRGFGPPIFGGFSVQAPPAQPGIVWRIVRSERRNYADACRHSLRWGSASILDRLAPALPRRGAPSFPALALR